MTGRLFLVVGASGVGKDTLLSGAVAADPALHWARRVITRPQIPGGEPFEGISLVAFEARLLRGDFALHWQAHGLRYGVPLDELAALADGRDVLVNGSRGAIAQARAAFPGLVVILITAQAAALGARLAARGREAQSDITARLMRAPLALPAGLPVITVQNDASPAEGVAHLLRAIRGDP